MKSDLQMIFILVGCLVFIALLRWLAGKKSMLGRFVRWWWNMSFYIVSLVPFMGWMAHFIIADTREEKMEKEARILAGEESDERAWDDVEKRNKEEQRKQEQFSRLNEQAKKKYGQGLRAFDEGTGVATLKDGSTVQVWRES